MAARLAAKAAKIGWRHRGSYCYIAQLRAPRNIGHPSAWLSRGGGGAISALSLRKRGGGGGAIATALAAAEGGDHFGIAAEKWRDHGEKRA